jgi:hypothetical protein
VTQTGLCARPGCAAVAGAWLAYDYAGQQVWLDDVDTPSEGNRWALCLAHAERLSVPRGWIVQDRRTGASADASEDGPADTRPPGPDGSLGHPDRHEGDAELSSLAG